MRLTSFQLQVRLQALIEAGELPSAPPIPAASFRPGTPADPRMRIGDPSDESARCMICLEAGSGVSYVYRDGRTIRVHAACHRLWRTAASVMVRSHAMRAPSSAGYATGEARC
jgi:hypothetical protein